MPNRIIKESICTSNSIGQLSWFEEVLFYRLIVACDDFGRYDGRPVIIKNKLFPLKEKLTVRSVSDALSKLASVGLVALYEVDGKPYLCLPSWLDHQSKRASSSKYPEPVNGYLASESDCKQLHADESKCPRIRIRESYSYSGIEEVVAEWNKLPVTAVSKVSPGTERYRNLNARIKENGIENVIRAIRGIMESDFLQGKNDKGWTVTFDWFVKPNNFVKVLEGNYRNQDKPKGKQDHHGTYTPDTSEVKLAYQRLLEEEGT